MIGSVEIALRAKLAAIVTDWPTRWPNEPWPAGVLLSNGNLPVELDADGIKVPRPFVEAEVIGGDDDLLAIGPAEDGKRTSRLSGLLRVYLCVPQGTGTVAARAQASAIVAAFKRAVILNDGGLKLATEDPRADDGVAGYEEGGRYCTMVSIPWDCWYRS